ncbi:MAG: 2Fe-2S iron-sulfur cluster-binding protein [Nocardioides sp.]
MSVTITVDGRELEATEGETLVEATARHGIRIPTLCSSPEHRSVATCRVCTVRVNGQVVAGCTVPVRDGLTVELDTPELRDLRRQVVELLFSEGLHNCPSCEKSGFCRLQAVALDLEMTSSRFPYRHPRREADRGSARIWLERDRCILCHRCVDQVRDPDTGDRVFAMVGRGPGARIEIDPDRADRLTDEQVANAVELCPVGAILHKGRGYRTPIGQRPFDVRPVRERDLEAAVDD